MAITKLKYVLVAEILLPPMGIYRYSRIHDDKEICHRRQNSVMPIDI